VSDGLVVELLGERGLVGGELGPAPAEAYAGAGRGEAVVGVGHDQLALELGEHAEHAEHRPALDGLGVDALLDDVQADPALAQVGAEGHQVQDRAREPVEPGDLHGAAAQELHDQVELGAGGFGAAGGVDVDVVPVDAGPQKSVDLVIGVLVGGRAPRVAEEYVSECSRRPLADVDIRREFSTQPICGSVMAP